MNESSNTPQCTVSFYIALIHRHIVLYCFYCFVSHYVVSPQWAAADEEMSHLLRTQSLKVLPLKPGVGQYIAINATLTISDFFLANFYPSGPFTCMFHVLAVANSGSCVGPQNKNRSPCWVQVPMLSAQ